MRRSLLVFTCLLLLPALTALAGPRLYKGAYKKGAPADGKTDGVEGVADDFTLPVGLPLPYEAPVPAADDHSSTGGAAAAAKKIVYTLEMRDDVGPPSWRAAQAAMRQARNMKADVLLIHMGGNSASLEMADNIRKGLKDFEKPVLLYFDEAASTPARIISMGGDSVYVSSKKKAGKAPVKSNASAAGKNIPAAPGRITDVSMDTRRALSAAPEAATASAGQLHEADDMADVLRLAGISDYKMVQHSPGFFDRFIDLLLQPFPALLLASVILAAALAYVRRKAGMLALGTGLLALLFYTASNYLDGSVRSYELLLLLAAVAIIYRSGVASRQYQVPLASAGLLLLLFSLSLLRLNSEPVFHLQHFGSPASLLSMMQLMASAAVVAIAFNLLRLPGRQPALKSNHLVIPPLRPAADNRR